MLTMELKGNEPTLLHKNVENSCDLLYQNKKFWSKQIYNLRTNKEHRKKVYKTISISASFWILVSFKFIE